MFCSLDGKQKSYCTPEAYRGDTCWLFRNRGNGTFEDVTATSGIFDTSSKSLGVAMLDYDRDGWPDLLRRQRHAAEQAAIATCATARSRTSPSRRASPSAPDGKARAGMGVDAADFDNSGTAGPRHHELRQRDDRLVSSRRVAASVEDVASRAGIGPRRHATRWDSAALFADLRSRRPRSTSSSPTATSTRPSATSAATSATRSRLHSVPQPRATALSETSPDRPAAKLRATESRAAASPAATSTAMAIVDLLITTNNGPAMALPQRSSAPATEPSGFVSIGTQSNRDAIGAAVRIFHDGVVAVAHGQERLELPLAVRAAGNASASAGATASTACVDRLAERKKRGTQEPRSLGGPRTGASRRRRNHTCWKVF